MASTRKKAGNDAGNHAGNNAGGKRRIAIACQGGGSQTAFTAGALRGLLEGGVRDDFEIVSLSGTSGGAICAALAWFALMKGDAQPWLRLVDFWRDNAAGTPLEKAFNDYIVGMLRMTNAGRLPSLAFSPSEPWAQALMHWSGHTMRPQFTDFRGLLEKHIDFAELARWGARDARPVLLIGAVEVLSGRLAKFSSRNETVRVEQILASCAVPNLFPAVALDGGAYWDGLFSDNPPLSEMLQAAFVGEANIAQEIWVIKINPTAVATVPSTSDQITDRRNELIGNVSLFQQLDAVAVMNELYLKGAFRPEFAKRFELDGPVKIPRRPHDGGVRPYEIPFIEMSPTMSASLDYESKIDRDAAHIEALMADGIKQAAAFLAQRRTALGLRSAKMRASPPRI